MVAVESNLMLIGGEPTAGADDNWFDVVNPATEEVITRVPKAGSADVDHAVAAARVALPGWSATSVRDRINRIHRLAEAIGNDRDHILELEVADSGNTAAPVAADIDTTINALLYYAGLAYEAKGETVPSTPGNLHLSVRESVGIVARIIPFNHPFMFAAAKLAAPLVTGNCVVVKPSEQSPLTALRLGKICQGIFPPGVVNIVTGGAVTGQALVRHPDVRRIAFIGSVRAGLAIQRTAAQAGVKNVTLELGGKNPMIVFPDVDIDEATTAAVAGMNFSWQGQSCGSTSRLFVHDSIYQEALALLEKKMSELVVGDPHDPRTDMGPINSRAQYEKDLAYIQAAHDDGAVLLTGGGRPEGSGYDKGFWLRPTAFRDVRPDMRIFREEVFGPVLSVIRWSDVDEVIEMANSVEFGLTAAVWTNDLNLALSTTKRLQAGYIWVNDTSAHYPGTSFGGIKNSGLGREEGLEELLSYTETKTMHIRIRSQPSVRGPGELTPT